MIGTGASDYLDPLLDPPWTKSILEALQLHVRQNGEWEVCDWQDLFADTPLGGLGRVRDDTPCSQVAITGSFEEFLAARPKDLQYKKFDFGRELLSRAF